MTVHRSVYRRIILLSSLSALLYLTLWSGFLPRIVLFVFVSLLTSGLYCIMAWMICRDEEDYSTNVLIWIVVVSVAFRLMLVALEPIGSDDVYRYIWDGKVQAAGKDPYLFEPSNPSLQPLHTGMLPAKINFPSMKTGYPPFAEWAFALVYLLAGESVVGYKIAFLVIELVSIGLLFILLKGSKRPLKYLALYVLCPLPILQFALEGHCDVLVFPFLLGLILLWKGGIFARFLSYCSAGFAILAKIYPVIFLPAMLVGEKKVNWRVALLIPVVIVGGAYLPYWLKSSFPFESLKVFSLNWAANGLLFEGVYALLQNNQIAHIIVMILLACWIGLILMRNLSLEQRIFEITLGFFIFSSTVHPWYGTVVAVMLPILPRKSGIVFVALLSLATITLIPYVMNGIWRQSFLVMALEYIPVYVLLALEMADGRWERMNGKRTSIPTTSS